MEREKHSPNFIYTVYVLYGNNLEQLYSFTKQERAKSKRLELLREWVNSESFLKYCNSIGLMVAEAGIETYDDYFMIVEDDSYVGIKEVELEG